MLKRRVNMRSGSDQKSLEEFIHEHDLYFYGPQALDVSLRKNPVSGTQDLPSLRSLDQMVNLRIVNSFPTVADLYDYLDDLDLTNPERLRPGWDTYFMQLASLASLRSNCMKRRVGALLVRDKRVLSTGYVSGCTSSVPHSPEGCLC